MAISELSLDKYKKIIKESLKNEAELIVMNLNKSEVFNDILSEVNKV